MLRRAGAQDGDDVWIGEAVFEYFDENRSDDENGAEPTSRDAGDANGP
jgi:hypothetical protein